MTDGSNALSTSTTYEPYGKTTATETNPFRFTGREDDGATGLQFNRARYYSPGLSRFISQDPIGLGGGPNVYGYAGMAPTVFTDPMGLAQTSGSDGFAEMVLGGGNPGQEMGGSPQSEKDCGFGGWRCYDDWVDEHVWQIIGGIGTGVCIVASFGACAVVTASIFISKEYFLVQEAMATDDWSGIVRDTAFNAGTGALGLIPGPTGAAWGTWCAASKSCSGIHYGPIVH